MKESKQDIIRLLEEGQTIQIETNGYSMYPMFVPGRDFAELVRARPQELKRGDVVLYRRDEGLLVLHRLYKRRAEGFYMVGDNQVEVEGPLRADQMKGVLTAFVRKGRRIPVNHPIYRLTSGLWLLLRPCRNPLKNSLAWCKRRLRNR